MRTGLRIRGGKVHPEVKQSSIKFAKWLRANYNFPIRVPVYLSPHRSLKSMTGDMVFGTFFAPFDKNVEPYIRVATGDYLLDKKNLGRDNALAGILGTIAHEVVHYFQWIEGGITSEREATLGADDILDKEATLGADDILDKYADVVDHP